jgi:hypothetical protein
VLFKGSPRLLISGDELKSIREQPNIFQESPFAEVMLQSLTHYQTFITLHPTFQTPAQVGDTIQILVRNAAQSNFSMHPHGVFYNKTSEGAAYADNSNLSTASHGFVAPGDTYTYRVSLAACCVRATTL